MNKFIDVLTKVFSAKVFRWVWLAAMFYATVTNQLDLLIVTGTFYVVNELGYLFATAKFKHEYRFVVNAPDGFKVDLVESETEVAEK